MVVDQYRPLWVNVEGGYIRNPLLSDEEYDNEISNMVNNNKKLLKLSCDMYIKQYIDADELGLIMMWSESGHKKANNNIKWVKDVKNVMKERMHLVTHIYDSSINDFSGCGGPPHAFEDLKNEIEALGISNGWVYKVLKNSITRSSILQTNVNALAFSVDADTHYEIECEFMLASTNGDSHPCISMATPSGISNGVIKVVSVGYDGTTQYHPMDIKTAIPVIPNGVDGSNMLWPLSVSCVMVTGPTVSGVFVPKLASDSDGSEVRMDVGSFVKYKATDIGTRSRRSVL